MAGVPASSHPVAFNGGTITTPLVIEPTDASLVPLQVRASWNAISTNFFEITNTDSGVDFVAVNASGDLVIGDKTSGTEREYLPQQSAAVRITGGINGNPLESGALPTVAPVSGTAFQCSAVRDVTLCVPFTGDATNNAATLKIELSPDNVTFSTLDTLSIAAALNLTGAINTPVSFAVPAGWSVKLTAVHGAIGTSTYY